MRKVEGIISQAEKSLRPERELCKRYARDPKDENISIRRWLPVPGESSAVRLICSIL